MPKLIRPQRPQRVPGVLGRLRRRLALRLPSQDRGDRGWDVRGRVLEAGVARRRHHHLVVLQPGEPGRLDLARRRRSHYPGDGGRPARRRLVAREACQQRHELTVGHLDERALGVGFLLPAAPALGRPRQRPPPTPPVRLVADGRRGLVAAGPSFVPRVFLLGRLRGGSVVAGGWKRTHTRSLLGAPALVRPLHRPLLPPVHLVAGGSRRGLPAAAPPLCRRGPRPVLLGASILRGPVRRLVVGVVGRSGGPLEPEDLRDSGAPALRIMELGRAPASAHLLEKRVDGRRQLEGPGRAILREPSPRAR